MMKLATGAFLALLAFALPLSSVAQDKPEKIEGFVKVRMPQQWYARQADLWRAEVDRNPRDANAWLNYYKATRYRFFGDSTDWEKIGESGEKIVREMEHAVPNTFEYYYVRWMAGGMDFDRFPDIQKAYELRQDYAQLASNFISYYELQGNREQVEFFSRKWYESKDMAPALLEYTYNVLMSLDRNAVLITSGDNDTYPVWMLQSAKGIRPDVTVMNMSLISVAEYRARMMKEQNIKGDSTLLDWEKLKSIPYDSWMGEFLKSVAEQNRARPVYFALTCNPGPLSLIKENLYTVGLANRYSPERIDNIALLKRNWEKFRLDYLDLAFNSEDYLFNTSWLPKLNMNYVTPAMLLYEHYHLAGDVANAAACRQFVLKRAQEGGEQKEVEQYLAKIDGVEEEIVVEQPKQAQSSAATDRRENTLVGEVTVLPNPAHGLLKIRLPEALDADIQIVDTQGSIRRRLSTREQQTDVNIEGLPSGTYIVHIRTAKGNISRTVRIEK